jgi:hypothetical protein
MDLTRLPDATLLDALQRARAKLKAADGVPEAVRGFALRRLPEELRQMEEEAARRGLVEPG